MVRLRSIFGLKMAGDRVRWNARCRFELVIFSLLKGPDRTHVPFIFRHQASVISLDERPLSECYDSDGSSSALMSVPHQNAMTLMDRHQP